MTVDLAALAKLSTEATPGPWRWVYDSGALMLWDSRWPGPYPDPPCLRVVRKADSAYIAAASPDVVAALVRVALAADALRLVYAGVNIKSKLLSELFGAVDALDLAR